MKTKLVLFIKKNRNFLSLVLTYLSLWSIFCFSEIIEKIYTKNFKEFLFSNFVFLGSVIILLLINIFYILFYKKINKITFKKLFIFSIFTSLALSLAWPIATSDMFGYIYQGRIFSVFKESPYLSTYSNFYFDNFFHFLKNIWISHPAPYGPIFIFITSFFSFLFKNDVVLNLIFLKIFLSVINIINGYLIYKITKEKLCFYLYAFNPLVLFELSVNSHNDSILIFFILISFLFFQKGAQQIIEKEKLKNYTASFLFLSASFLTKFISLIFIPIFAIITLFDFKKTSNKIKSWVIYFLLFIFLCFVFYRPLVNNIYEIFIPITKQSLLRGFYSPVVIVLKGLFLNIKNGSLIAVLVGKILFIFFFSFTMLKLLNLKKNLQSKDLIKIYFKWTTLVLIFFYATFFSWILPWYFTLLIALLLINYKGNPKHNSYLYLNFFITIYGILYYIILR